MGKNVNVHEGVARHQPGETGRERTKPEGLQAKPCRLHPDDTRNVEGGLAEAKILGGCVYSSWHTCSKQGAGPKCVCACWIC